MPRQQEIMGPVPYEFRDPKTRVEKKKALQSRYNRLMKMAGFINGMDTGAHLDSLWEQSWGEAKGIEGVAKRLYDMKKQEAYRDLNKYKNEFHRIVKEGGLQFIEHDTRLSPWQEHQAKREFERVPYEEKSYGATPPQALKKTIKELDLSTDELAGLLLYSTSFRGQEDRERYLGERSEDIAKEFEKHITSQHVGYPDQGGSPWYMVPVEALGTTESAASGALEGAIAPLQEEVIQRKEFPEKPTPVDFDIKRDMPSVQEGLAGTMNYMLQGPRAILKEVPKGAEAFGQALQGVSHAAEAIRPVLPAVPNLLYGAGKAAELAGPVSRYAEQALAEAEPPDIKFSAQDAMDRVHDAATVISAINPAVSAPPSSVRSEARFAGVPLKKAGGWLADSAINKVTGAVPVRGETILDKTVSGAMEGVENILDPTARNQAIRRSRAGASQIYEEASGGNEEDYKGMWRQDLAIKNPNAAQLVQEGALGVAAGAASPVLLGGKALTKGTRALRQVARAKGGVADEILTAGEEAMTWLPEIRPLEGAQPELASALRAGAQKGQMGAPRLFHEVEEILQQLPEAGSQRSADLMLARTYPKQHAVNYVLKYGKSGKQDLKNARDIATKYAKVQQKLGFLTDYDKSTGVLSQRQLRKNYAPTDLRALDDAEEAQFQKEFGHVTRQSRDSRLGAATEAHAKVDQEHALLDFTKQWGNKISKGKRRAQPTMEMQEISNVTREYGSRAQLVRPRVIASRKEMKSADAAVEAAEGAVAKQREKLAGLKSKYESGVDEKSLFEQQMRQAADDATVDFPQSKRLNQLLGSVRVKAERTLRKEAQNLGRAERELEQLKVVQLETSKNHLAAIQNDTKLQSEIRRLSERDGVQYVPLDPYDRMGTMAVKKGLAPGGESYRRVTGKLGQSTKYGEIELVPEPIAKRIDTLTATLDVSPKAALKAVTAVDKYFLAPVLRPAQRLWRGTHTLLSVPYYLRNAFGAFGLSTIALGMKGLNPKHHAGAVAAAIASGDLFDEGLRMVKWTTPAGVETTIGEVIDAAAKMGIIDMADLRTGLGMRAKGPVDAVAKGIEDAIFRFRLPGKNSGKLSAALGVDKISLANANRVIDNYQHFAPFMGHLKDPKNMKSLYESADFASQFGGAYNRLGSLEKSFLRDTMGFYSWYRYIGPHSVKQMMNHPQRYAAWNRALRYKIQENAKNAPVTSEAFPGWAEGNAYMADASLQPGAYPEWSEKEDPDTFAITNIESPIYMITSLLRPFGETRELANFAGPAIQAASLLLGRDLRTGEAIPEFFTLENGGLPDWAENTRVGRAAFMMIDRPTKDYMNIINLYLNAGDIPGAVNMAMRYKAGNALQGLDRALANTLSGLGLPSFEPQSIGGILHTGEPTFNYPASPLGEAYRKSRKAWNTPWR